MSVQIINHQHPPNFEAIKAVFPLATRNTVIFAYGDKIFVPGGMALRPEKLAHELVHCERQRMIGVEIWWHRYLTDTDFRYEEELLAHRAEYLKLIEAAPSRQIKRRALAEVGKLLAAPLYGRMKSKQDCMEDILK